MLVKATDAQKSINATSITIYVNGILADRFIIYNTERLKVKGCEHRASINP